MYGSYKKKGVSYTWLSLSLKELISSECIKGIIFSIADHSSVEPAKYFFFSSIEKSKSSKEKLFSV